MSSENKLDLERYRLIVETVYDTANPTILGAQITQLLVSSMAVKGAAVFVVNPATETLENLAAEGLSIDYKSKGPILVDKSIRLPSNLKPVIIADTRDTDQLQYPEKAEREGIRSIVSLPIKLRKKLIGALRVYHSEPWEISGQDLVYLGLLTLNLGMALRYFRLSAVVLSVKDKLDEIHPIWL